MGDDAGLVLTDNAPTGWYGARLGRIEPGDTVAVIGLGPVGLMAVAAGGRDGRRRSVLGVDLVADRAGPGRGTRRRAGDRRRRAGPRSPALTGGRGADVVVEAVGADATVALALDLAGRMGRVSVVGVNKTRAFPVDMLTAQLKCLELHDRAVLGAARAAGPARPDHVGAARPGRGRHPPPAAGGGRRRLRGCSRRREDDVGKVVLDVAP